MSINRILKASTFNELITKVDALESILSAVEFEDAENITLQEQVDTIVGLLQVDPSTAPEAEALQTQLNELTAEVERLSAELKTQTERADSLQNELDITPAAEPATIAPKSNVPYKVQSIAEFADANAGDTASILAKALEDGLL